MVMVQRWQNQCQWCPEITLTIPSLWKSDHRHALITTIWTTILILHWICYFIYTIILMVKKTTLPESMLAWTFCKKKYWTSVYNRCASLISQDLLGSQKIYRDLLRSHKIYWDLRYNKKTRDLLTYEFCHLSFNI